MKHPTGLVDCNQTPIHYGELLDFTWWDQMSNESHLKCKIRKRKSGDIFEFIEDCYGRPCHFTHKLSALIWVEDDLMIIKKDE